MGTRKLKPMSAPESEKWKAAAEAARKTATWAKTMTKVVIRQNSAKAPFWHVVNFLGAKKAESRGIVDLLAIRKNHADPGLPLKKGDLFEVVLIQVKGGSAKWPTLEDKERLNKVGEAYQAKAILLAEWKKGSKAVFYRLNGDEWGERIEPAEVFGPRSKVTGKTKSKTTSSKKSVVPPASSKSNAAKKAWATRKAAQAGAAKP